jgi:hypothetical protein
MFASAELIKYSVAISYCHALTLASTLDGCSVHQQQNYSQKCNVLTVTALTCRLGDIGEAYSGAGVYNVEERQLTLFGLGDRAVAFTASNSTWLGTFWIISGAGLYNAAFFVDYSFETSFNDVHFPLIVEPQLYGEEVPTFTEFTLPVRDLAPVSSNLSWQP